MVALLIVVEATIAGKGTQEFSEIFGRLVDYLQREDFSAVILSYMIIDCGLSSPEQNRNRVKTEAFATECKNLLRFGRAESLRKTGGSEPN